MPKKIEKFTILQGYNVWSRSRTIDEAHNIARWNPWLAHEWMEESVQGATIADYDMLEKHDKTADKINAMWRRRTKYHFYDEKQFWSGVPPKMIPKCMSDNDYDIIGTEEE